MSIRAYWCGKDILSLSNASLCCRVQQKHCYSHLLFKVRVLLTLPCLNVTATKRANKFLADKSDSAISKNRKASITYYPEFISSPSKGEITQGKLWEVFLSARKICPVPQAKNKLL